MAVQPVLSIPYEKIDWWGEDTDAKFIEFCISSFDPEHFSLRVHRRRDDGGYSRMSEQLPLHRPIDLIIILVKSLGALKEAQYNIHFSDGEFGKTHDGSPTPDALASMPPQLISKVIKLFTENTNIGYMSYVINKLKALQELLNAEMPHLEEK